MKLDSVHTFAVVDDSRKIFILMSINTFYLYSARKTHQFIHRMIFWLHSDKHLTTTLTTVIILLLREWYVLNNDNIALSDIEILESFAWNSH